MFSAARRPVSRQAWYLIGDKRIFFRSKWEANYGKYLEFLRKRGQIREWEHEPMTFWFEAIKRGVRSYLPDFRILPNEGEPYYVEVKGYMDAKSATKLKRMKKYYPDVEVKLVDSQWFARNNAQMKRLIAGWE